jgi:hypothetical protein
MTMAFWLSYVDDPVSHVAAVRHLIRLTSVRHQSGMASATWEWLKSQTIDGVRRYAVSAMIGNIRWLSWNFGASLAKTRSRSPWRCMLSMAGLAASLVRRAR